MIPLFYHKAKLKRLWAMVYEARKQVDTMSRQLADEELRHKLHSTEEWRKRTSRSNDELRQRLEDVLNGTKTAKEKELEKRLGWARGDAAEARDEINDMYTSLDEAFEEARRLEKDRAMLLKRLAERDTDDEDGAHRL